MSAGRLPLGAKAAFLQRALEEGGVLDRDGDQSRDGVGGRVEFWVSFDV